MAVAIARDGAFPLLRLNATTVDKWGMDGADVKYTSARLSGDGVYRVTGTLGTAPLIALQVAARAPRYQAFASLSRDASPP